jgi:cytochrome P450
MNARAEIDFSIYNPYAPEFIRNPMPTWRRLLEEYPVAWHRDMRTWVVCPHDLAHEALKHPRFSLRFEDWEYAPPPRPEQEKTDFDRSREFGLGYADPASHMRLRKLTMPAFSKRVMSKIEEKIHDLISDCFDQIGTPDEFDVYEKIGRKIPVPSISRMVGVSKDAEELFEHGLTYNLVRSSNPLFTPEERAAARKATLPGFAFLKEMVLERRAMADPGDDFLGTLVATVDENGDRLSDWDIIALITALITAGADTVLDLHTCAIHELLSHPDQYQLLRERPELMENAILEILRHGAPGKTGPIPRYALEDTELGGQIVRKGQAVMVAMSAAWNDPARWPEPERFDITRPKEGNLIFGAGPHFCIGLNLVKVQGKLMIQEFMRRFPDAELVGDVDYDYQHFNARRMNQLRVKTNLRKAG